MVDIQSPKRMEIWYAKLPMDRRTSVQGGSRPVLIISGDGDKNTVLQAIRPLMDEQPRGRQISDVIFVKEPLPRTATGKIKRWELQQKEGKQ